MRESFMESKKTSGYRFGEFEVHLDTETLLFKSVPVSLQRLPFQMLVCLLEASGRIVSRTELKDHLWKGQTFLQFENGLHVAAAKLRDALGEQAASPIYIKTLASKGYQFIGESVAYVDAPPPLPQPEIAGAKASQPSSGRSWKLLLYSAGSIAFASAVILFFYFSMRHTAIGHGQKMLVGSITNDTGDAQLDHIFDVPFQLKLRESQYLNFVVPRPLKETAKPPTSPKSVDQLSSCLRDGVQFLVTGHVEHLQHGYRVTVAALRCKDGRAIATQAADSPTQLTILSALGQATEDLRRSLGEPDAMLQRSNTPIAQATTNSMAALRAFTMAEAKRTPATVDEAISYYKIAIALDPRFAIAYAHLGVSYFWRGDDSLGKQALTMAFNLRDQATDHEKLSIASRYYDLVTGEVPQAVQTYNLWQSMFPYDPEPKNGLASIYSTTTSEMQKALNEATAAVALDPDNAAYKETLAQAHSYAGDYAYLNHQCVDANSPGAGTVTYHGLCYLSYFAQGNKKGMKQELEAAKSPLQIADIQDDAAWVAASEGRIADSRALFQQSHNAAMASQTPDLAALTLMEEAMVEAEVGLKEQARKDASLAVSENPQNPEIRGFGAMVLANCGYTSGAIAMSTAAASQSPLDSVLNSTILGSMRSILALNAQDAQGAAESGNNTSPYDFNAFTYLAPAYYRGVAYEDGRNWKAATIEFQAVLSHRAIAPHSLYVPLAKLELAHSLAESGDQTRADSLFKDLSTLWKNADKGFIPLKRLNRYKEIAVRLALLG